jgi:hypothetical protein
MAVAGWATHFRQAARIRTRTFYRVRPLFGKFEARDVAALSQLFKSNRLAATLH